MDAWWTQERLRRNDFRAMTTAKDDNGPRKGARFILPISGQIRFAIRIMATTTADSAAVRSSRDLNDSRLADRLTVREMLAGVAFSPRCVSTMPAIWATTSVAVSVFGSGLMALTFMFSLLF